MHFKYTQTAKDVIIKHMKSSKENIQSQICDWKNCKEHGKHPAPKSPDSLGERQYFCLEHIRKYNNSWDYFAGMKQEDIQKFHINSIYGHRPTSRMGVDKNTNINTEELRKKIFDEFGFKQQKHETKKLPDGEQKFLAILGFNTRQTLDKIKERYKELAKKLHPDLNKGASSEELKSINQAYSYLKKLYKGK